MTKLTNFLKNNVLYIVLVISWVATLGSLVFSEIVKLPPCDLCWYQRALMYPIAIITLVAHFIKDTRASKYYIFVLSLIGALIALYHYIYQLQYMQGINNPLIPCDPNNPCGEAQVLIFGFITIPLMSFVAFATIIALLLISRHLNRKKY